MKPVFLFLMVGLLASCQDAVENTSDRIELCGADECPGDAPLAPNYLCEDGMTLAGPACVRGESVCSWQILSCAACAPDDCGPAPLAPNYQCDDGENIAGPACLPSDRDGMCAWQIIECPATDPCGPGACSGVAPLAPNYLCEDGMTLAGPACTGQPDACEWTIVTCP